MRQRSPWGKCGIIGSPFTDKTQTPIQPSRSEAVGRVEPEPEFSEGLQGIEGFSRLILLYVFHCSDEYTLRVKPFLGDQWRGLFATRYRCRPNPIGLSLVHLLARQGNVLKIAGVDVLDGTPLLDVKPYVPEFDIKAEVQAGWYEYRSKE